MDVDLLIHKLNVWCHNNEANKEYLRERYAVRAAHNALLALPQERNAQKAFRNGEIRFVLWLITPPVCVVLGIIGITEIVRFLT